MSNEKFTQGEWVIGDGGGYIHVTMGKYCVCTSFESDKDKANAHLIAAAPGMYRMLERVLKETPSKWLNDDDCNRRQDIEKLLAKARGES